MGKPFMFGEFAPDLSLLSDKAVHVAQNVLPELDGYSPFSAFISLGVDPLPSLCLGVISVKGTDGVSRTFFGTDTKLFELGGTALVDQTNISGDYSLDEDEHWDFTQYKNKLVATCISEEVQAIDLGANNFVDLFTSTKKPRARYATVANLDWLVLANTVDDDDLERPTRVWWSSRGDIADMDPDINNKSGFRDLDYLYGDIVGIYSREYTIVYQERALHRMTYVGGDIIFRFDLISTNLGPLSRGAITHFAGNSFFLSRGGFYQFDGSSVMPIGEEKVNNYVLDQLDYSSRPYITSAVYPRRSIVAFGVPVAGGKYSSRILLYNWQIKRWSEIIISIEKLLSSYTLGVSVDDSDYEDLYVDSYPQVDWPVDDAAFASGTSFFSGVDLNHNYVGSLGDNLPATIETKYVNVAERVITDTIVPLIENVVNPQLYVIVRDDLGDSETIYGPFDRNLFYEFVPVIQGRFIRFRITFDGFTKATGLDVSFKKVGGRNA